MGLLDWLTMEGLLQPCQTTKPGVNDMNLAAPLVIVVLGSLLLQYSLTTSQSALSTQRSNDKTVIRKNR